MNTFVPSFVVARFRATSRKLFRPNLIFSARMVSNWTASSPPWPLRSSSLPSRPFRVLVKDLEAAGTRQF